MLKSVLTSCTCSFCKAGVDSNTGFTTQVAWICARSQCKAFELISILFTPVIWTPPFRKSLILISFQISGFTSWRTISVAWLKKLVFVIFGFNIISLKLVPFCLPLNSIFKTPLFRSQYSKIWICSKRASRTIFVPSCAVVVIVLMRRLENFRTGSTTVRSVIVWHSSLKGETVNFYHGLVECPVADSILVSWAPL